MLWMLMLAQLPKYLKKNKHKFELFNDDDEDEEDRQHTRNALMWLMSIFAYCFIGIIMCCICPIIGCIMTALLLLAVIVVGFIMAANWDKEPE